MENLRKLDSEELHSLWTSFATLSSKNIPVVPQLPYSPDLSLSDYFLFSTIKTKFRSQYLEIVKNIQKFMSQVKAMSLEDFQHYFQECRLHHCMAIASQGNYFDDDKIDLYLSW